MRTHCGDRGKSNVRLDLVPSGPAVLAVVGEHRADPDRLLLLGDDGTYYTYCDDRDDPVAVELTADWIVDMAVADAA
jgi:hypothetical protein